MGIICGPLESIEEINTGRKLTTRSWGRQGEIEGLKRSDNSPEQLINKDIGVCPGPLG